MERSMKTTYLISKISTVFDLQWANLDFDPYNVYFGWYLAEILRFRLNLVLKICENRPKTGSQFWLQDALNEVLNDTVPTRQ